MIVIASTVSAPHTVEMCPGWFVKFLEGLQTLADFAGLAAMAIGLLGGILIWLWGELKTLRSSKFDRWVPIRRARLFIGNYILLGLELMIVSDIIHSFLQPDLESLYTLGLIVVIRTAISYFLGKELEVVSHEAMEEPNF